MRTPLTFSLILYTSFLSMFINDLLTLWFIMESNNLIFLFYLIMNIQNKKMIFLYFLTQIMASSLLLISLMMNYSTYLMNLIISTMIIISLMLKIGVPPLHLWTPMMSMYMHWNMLFMFLTIQKIIPFMMLYNIPIHSILYTIMLIMCMILPPYMILNMTNIKKIISYSSINQMGWLILLIYSSLYLWILYMIFYSFSLFIIITFMKYKKMNSYSWMKSYTSTKISMLIMMINFSGLPPFSFFIIKWYSIFLFMYMTKFNLLMFIMLFSSLMMMYTYINMIIKISLMNSSNNKLIMIHFYNKILFIIPMMILMSSLILIL